MHNIEKQRYDFPIFDEKSIHYMGIRAPLYQQAFDWFRKKHGLWISSERTIDDNVWYWFYIEGESKRTEVCDGDFEYEVARLKCLKKLIEIIK